MLQALEDPDVFHTNFVVSGSSPCSDGAFRASTWCRPLREAVDAGLCSSVPRQDSLRGEAQAFPVMKSDGFTARIIIDPALNQRVHKPPPCGLDPLHRLLDWAGQFKAAVTIDMKSWFNQFFLHPSVACFFVFRARPARRGPAQYFRFNRLPMGFSYAPAIAQRTALLILRAAGLGQWARCWIDNII